MKPPFPSNESARILSLYKTQLLDTEFEERFDRITRTARRFFDVDISLVTLLDQKRNWFKSANCIPGIPMEERESPRELSFCGHAILQKEIMIIEDTLEDPRFKENPLVEGGLKFRFYAGVPIYSPEKYALGTLCLIHSQPNKLSDEQVETLKDLAGIVEDQLHLSVEATIDKLTQISNRAGFELIAKQILAVCRRERTSAQLLFFDIDNLKTVNDQEGHQAGDDLLREFGQILKLCFRESDLVARIGGDEFAVLLAGDQVDSNAVLTRLENIASIAFSVGEKSKLSWSVGIARYSPSEDQSLDVLLKDADIEMYKEKRTRKSQQRDE